MTIPAGMETPNPEAETLN